jgi:hypothetical protein
MKRPMMIVSALIAVLGAVTLFGILFGIRSLSAQSEQQKQNDTEHLNTADLGAMLMARVGRNFVADSRKEWPAKHGVNFYAAPKPYGSWLCRVDVVSIAGKIVMSEVEGSANRWDDDIDIKTGYGTWTSPTNPSEDRDKGCSEYREFNELFFVDEKIDPLRAAFLLDTLISDARQKATKYPIQCWDAVEDIRDKPKPCDGNATLAALALSHLGSAQSRSETEMSKSKMREDELFFRLDSKSEHPLVMTVNVTSEQHYGKQSSSEADIRAVTINKSYI